MGDRQAYIKDIRDHYTKSYSDILNLKSIHDSKTREYLEKSDTSAWSHRNRITGNLQMLKYSFNLPKTDTIVSCFKMTMESTSCIYGYLHSEYIPGKMPKFEHKFMCAGPTFRSQDGEYRHKFIPYNQVINLIELYPDIFQHVESLAISRMETQGLEFQTDFYYPSNIDINTRKFEDSINTSRIAIKLFMACWIYDFYQIHNKIIENHVNPAYQYLIYRPEEIKVYDDIIASIGRDGYWGLLNKLSRFYPDLNASGRNIIGIECGQKIFPLTIFEAVKLDDIHFNVWREIYITNLCSNLVLNLISPSFPFINNWFYVQNSHGGLFDNIAMHDKYLHSNIANDITTQLKNADKLNYLSGDKRKGYINSKFMKLSRAIQKGIIYSDSNIKLTDLSICVTSEYVGRTLRDIPILIANHEFQPGLDLLFTDYDIFAKHMFEFIYGFYCMNSKAGVMHGDLHMNNATIYRLYVMLDSKGQSYVNNPRIVYIVDSSTYIFPHYGLFSSIIDFSRAIIGDYDKIVHEFGPMFAELYFKDQRIRVMRSIHHYFPKLVEKYQPMIEALLISNFSLMFKILSALDTFVIMTNIRAMLSIDDAFTQGRIKLADNINDLLNKLIQSAESLVITNMHAAINGKIKSDSDIEWPNLTIIKKHFIDYKLTAEIMKDPMNNILEIFNSTNDVTYDIEDYDTWGPLLSLDKEIELKKKHKIQLEPDIEDWLRYKNLDETANIETIINRYEQADSDIVQYESWMLI